MSLEPVFLRLSHVPPVCPVPKSSKKKITVPKMWDLATGGLGAGWY